VRSVKENAHTELRGETDTEGAQPQRIHGAGNGCFEQQVRGSDSRRVTTAQLETGPVADLLIKRAGLVSLA